MYVMSTHKGHSLYCFDAILRRYNVYVLNTHMGRIFFFFFLVLFFILWKKTNNIVYFSVGS